MSTGIHYFAFGSNMCSTRFTTRIAGATSLGRARLDDWRFVCNKRGNDGSAKGNIMRRPGAFVWGVVFRMPEADLGRLDMIEGGYERTTVEVELDDRALACATYASTRRIGDAVPFDWYKRHIVAGAVEHGLPADYIAFLRLLPQRSPS